MGNRKSPISDKSYPGSKLTVTQSIHDILANSNVQSDAEIDEACNEFGRRFCIIGICRALAEIGYDAAWEIRELKKIVENAPGNQTTAKKWALERLARYAGMVTNQEKITKTPAAETKNHRNLDMEGKAGAGSAKDSRQKQHEKRYGRDFMQEVTEIDE